MEMRDAGGVGKEKGSVTVWGYLAKRMWDLLRFRTQEQRSLGTHRDPVWGVQQEQDGHLQDVYTSGGHSPSAAPPLCLAPAHPRAGILADFV